MSDNSPFLIITRSFEEAIVWITHRLTSAGLNVLRTFDLQVASQAKIECPCPHHGTEKCDCQMVVLLVYGVEKQPISIVAHSFEGRTQFSLVNTPHQRADPRLEAIIMQALTSYTIAASN